MTNPRAPLATTTSRGIVLDLIRSEGPISRVELAERTGLTQATMSTVVRQLILDGLVLETGRSESTGGKPRVLLNINPDARFAVGVQLGADFITFVVTNLSGAVVGRTRTRGVGDGSPDRVIERIAERIGRLLASLDIATPLVAGIGIVAPGPLDLEAGRILAPPTLATWGDFPVRAALQRATGLPVTLDNDATAAAIGEFWGGTVANAAAHCTVYMGAGIGAGIVLGGTVYRGASSNAGELGQLWVDDPTGTTPGGTVEDLAGPRAVAARARALIGAGHAAGFELSPDGDPFRDFDLIATAAVHGNPFALELIERSAGQLATAIVNLANILDLDSVVLAGPSFATAGSLYLTAAVTRLEQRFFARARHPVDVRLSAHVADAAAVGGAALILQQELSPRATELAGRARRHRD
ncbi:putative NBD/HSP70 family sugar kinase [Cryobacterium sp. MP_M5]|uniref:ROK family transcriptional regulator n=1 Tax=unclassified Cryobacterium TaxID=2649013 RepID=UPI0018CB3631|nr:MULTISPECIES: ROK family transcriptional regulator [unclassified Cryobacterium]MBG6059446.1 putative NBD/HSP70 family sugar kinase [Cryobacterium sp. MP_M3]MEC5177575.1 putative NBD/HSP70 family sugar kinase [Cryobacterium sp. MP_M5]